MNPIVAIEKPEYGGGTDVIIVQTVQPYPQAMFAMEMMKQFGLVVGGPDGEDSTGRQKSRLMPEEEVVARAVKIADLAWKEFESRGWLLETPLPKARPERH